MTLILEGKTLAGRIGRSAAVRAVEVRGRLGRPPALAAVAVDTGRPETLYFDVKKAGFEAAGASFVPHVLPAGTTGATLEDRIELLNADARIDGIYVQYPLPGDFDAQAAYDRITPDKDVDGAGRQPYPPKFFPATAESVIQLLQFHDIDIAGRNTMIIRGDPLFADLLSELFRGQGGLVTTVKTGQLTRDTLHSADIVVAATGEVNGVRASDIPDGAVAVDVGYYHGGGRGDIDASPSDIGRLAAYAPPRGSIGPLTIALLIAHTADAALRTCHDRGVR